MSPGKNKNFVSHSYARSKPLPPDGTAADSAPPHVYHLQAKVPFPPNDLGKEGFIVDHFKVKYMAESTPAGEEGADHLEAYARIAVHVGLGETPSPDTAESQKAPAGERAVGILRFLYTAKTFETIFAQTIADYRVEIAEAEAAGELGKGKWRRVQFVMALADAAFCHGINWLLERVEKVRKLKGD